MFELYCYPKLRLMDYNPVIFVTGLCRGIQWVQDFLSPHLLHVLCGRPAVCLHVPVPGKETLQVSSGILHRCARPIEVHHRWVMCTMECKHIEILHRYGKCVKELHRCGRCVKVQHWCGKCVIVQYRCGNCMCIGAAHVW